MANIPHAILVVEGRQAAWLTVDPCVRQEVAGEAYNVEHVAALVWKAESRVGLPLVAWLSLEPENPHDGFAVMVWIGGGRVGYLPRRDAFAWQPLILDLQRGYRMPVACAAHVELPPEAGPETCFQVVLWMPLLHREVPAQNVALGMAAAANEPAARMVRVAERQALERERARAEQAWIDETRANQERRRVALLAALDGEARTRAEEVLTKFGVEDGERILQHEMWCGQTLAMLVASRGNPEDIDEKVMATKTRHVFKYNRTGANRFRLRVTLDDGIVTGWESKA
jgi:hypothetical protein